MTTPLDETPQVRDRTLPRTRHKLPGWLAEVRKDDLPSFHAFASGLELDIEAVTAGLALPWNSGVVDSHVNHIRTKRQMFGRADFQIIRKIPPAVATERGCIPKVEPESPL